ncbi:MAG: ATP-binding protein [Gammaproteobacteria bacterium]|jgi:two-component system sensor histidine kinase QseC|nr:ATP-binding protein [Gammaproteobacteria bacterium]
MSSIRRYLVIVLLATITLVNFLAALHGYRSSMEKADQVFDAELVDIASVLAQATGSTAVQQISGQLSTGVVFQIWNDGEPEYASFDAPAGPIADLVPGYHDVNLLGYRWRAFTVQLPQPNRWLIVAERYEARFALAEKIIVESVLPIVLSLPLIGVLVWLIVGRGLQPLRGLAAEMAVKRADDLGPVRQDNPPAEVNVLISAINSLLGRLDESFRREKRFAADAAHQLRTPISVLKVQLHNMQRTAAADGGELPRLASAVERMGRSVEQILLLNRTAPGQFAASVEAVNLTEAAREEIAAIYPQIELLGQEIELVGDDVMMQGDAFCVHTLIANLLDNASKYSGRGGKIRVTCAATPAGAVLTVHDNGPGIDAELRERVFERFYRVGGDRHASGITGSGIGLSIVSQVLEILGARIELGESYFGAGLGVTVGFGAQATGPGKASS